MVQQLHVSVSGAGIFEHEIEGHAIYSKVGDTLNPAAKPPWEYFAKRVFKPLACNYDTSSLDMLDIP